jgi:mevalonate kinase
VRIQAPDIELNAVLDHLPNTHPLVRAIRLVFSELAISHPPACTIRVDSTIPIASGMGSGAAVSAAVIRAVSNFLGHPLPDERVSALTFEVEKLLHGTPSGIDNTVIAYAMPVFFQRFPEGNQIEKIQVGKPFTLVIGDTGVRSPTAAAVGDVRLAWQADQEAFEALFNRIGEVAVAARKCIVAGNSAALGLLMDQNHALLQAIKVSSPELDSLVEAARTAGAQGAKLSGGGRGGNMIALVEADRAEQVAQALRTAGAARTIVTTVHAA